MVFFQKVRFIFKKLYRQHNQVVEIKGIAPFEFVLIPDVDFGEFLIKAVPVA